LDNVIFDLSSTLREIKAAILEAYSRKAEPASKRIEARVIGLYLPGHLARSHTTNIRSPDSLTTSMLFMIISRLLAVAAWSTLVGAQTFQSVVPVDGNTVIIAISTDPIAGTVPVVIETLAPITDTAAVSTPLVTPAPVPSTAAATSTPLAAPAPAVTTTTPRVVGQPDPTTGVAGPTTYRYTTTDMNGQTIVLTDTYTPTYNVGTVSTPVVPGTIIPYDQYTSMYGGGSGSGSGSGRTPSGAVRQFASFGVSASAIICVLGGIAVLL